MGLVDSLSNANINLQNLLDELEKVKEQLHEQLFTTTGMYEEEEVFNYGDPYLSDSHLDDLVRVIETFEEEINELEEDLPSRIFDLFDFTALNEIKEVCDYGGNLRELSTFNPELIEDKHTETAHNEDLSDAVNDAAQEIAEEKERLAEKTENDARSMFENIDKLANSIQAMIDEL